MADSAAAEKQFVSKGQLTAILLISQISLVFCYSSLFGSVNLWSFTLPLICYVPLSLLITAPVSAFIRRNQGVSVSEYFSRQYGIFGRIISVLYGAFFLYISAGCVSYLRKLMQSYLSDGIDPLLIILLFTGACVFAAKKGIEAVFRSAGIVLVLIIVIIIAAVCFLAPAYSSSNLDPLSVIPAEDTAGSFLILSLLFSPAVCAAVLSPSVKGNAASGLTKSVLISILFLIAAVLLLRGTAGAYIDQCVFPLFHAAGISSVLQRFIPFLILSAVCSVFCTVSLMIVSFIKSIGPALKKPSETRSALSAGIFLLLFLILPEDISSVILRPEAAAITVFVFAVFLPLAALISRRKGSKKLRIAALILAVLMFIPSLSGCSRQLNECLIVQGVGIDIETDKVKLTAIILDTSDQEAVNSSSIVSSEGSSIKEALYSLEHQRGKKILMSHCLFVMIGEDMSGASAVISSLSERSDIKRSLSVMACSPSASFVIGKALNELGYDPETINVLSDSKEVDQSGINCPMYTFAQDVDIPVPEIVIDESTRSLKTDGSVVVRKNGSSYSLNEDQTTGALIISGELKNYFYSEKDKKGACGLRVTESSSKLVPKLKHGRLKLRFSAEISLDSRGDSDCISALKAHLTNCVNSCIGTALNGYGSDIFSVRRLITNAYPSVRFTDEHFTSLLINSETSVSIAVKG